MQVGSDGPRDREQDKQKKWDRKRGLENEDEKDEGIIKRGSKDPTRDLHRRHLEKLMEHPVLADLLLTAD